MCAAHGLGLELDYARYLARPRKEREVLVGPEAAMLRRLDEAEEPCGEAEPVRPDGPAGPWVDGRLVAVAQLGAALATLEADAPSPWAPWLAAAAAPLP
ncbi:MAG: hypothetical protein D6705_15725 [Deltaproteobacteria bacterium]|nr:MAG: hypothetical protein D6705_15725 [Deltaproteobacteria bacterium]